MSVNGEFDFPVIIVESFLDFAEADFNDFADVASTEGTVEDDLVDPIQEFMREGGFAIVTSLTDSRGIWDVSHLIAPMTRSLTSGRTAPSDGFSFRKAEPTLLVIMMIVFLKSTTRPLLSVSRPSSRTWRSSW